jgi:hypothetical protein
MAPVWIWGATNGLLRMDGSGVTSFSASGTGVVNGQSLSSPGPWEQFEIVEHSDGTVNIASVAFPGVFLRLDGRGVTSWTWNGGGTVNCQYTAGSWETFTIKTLETFADGASRVNIESVAFPNVYLRMLYDGGDAFHPGGAGTVNCQYTPGAYELFLLYPVTSSPPPPAGTVPDVSNLSPSQARARIQAAGFTYSESADPVKGNFKPYVEYQDPLTIFNSGGYRVWSSAAW